MILVLAFTLVVGFGYWLATTAVPPAREWAAPARATTPPARTVVADEAMPRFRRGERLPSLRGDNDAVRAGALVGQRVLVFKDQAALLAFLARMGDSIHLLGRLDALNALRVGFANAADLLALLDGDEQLSYIFPVSSPFPKDGSVQPGAVALNNRLLEWLGITGDNSNWGKGVLIAILDTGVVANPAFNTNIRAINLVDPPADSSKQDGHGTAVASMIIGHTALTPGVAPAANILSVRIADDNGQSDSYLLAAGIVAAADGGARLINISMGSEGDSGLVRNAIAYAIDKGILIVAATGNNGINQVSYPAANAGVIAVGAVDALGNLMGFSNTGDAVALVAPGYGLNAAWTGDQAVSFTGTSSSAPIIAGVIAAIMTEAANKNLSATQAYQLLCSYLNDGGAAGKDPQMGAGMPALDRVFNRNTPGIYDAAVAATSIIAPDVGNPNGQVEVVVQNRGTETLINTSVQISIGGGLISTNITSLVPNAVQTIHVPVSQSAADYPNGLRVDSRVALVPGLTDSRPTNDRRIETYVAAGSR